MLDPATGFGAGAVALFFPVGQRFAALNPAAVTLRFKAGFRGFGTIGAVGPHIPAGIAAIEQAVQGLRVVNTGIGDRVLAYQLGGIINVDVVLVPVIVLITFLGPTRLGILLATSGG